MLIPRPYNVFIQPVYDPDKTESGLYIPDMAKERVDQGVVKYVGERCRWLKVGDYVLFSGYAGETVDLEGEGLLIAMSERLVVAIVGDIDWSITNVPGLYFKDRNGEYLPAPAEYSIKLITDALSKALNIRRPYHHKSIASRPSTEDELNVSEDWDEFYEG